MPTPDEASSMRPRNTLLRRILVSLVALCLLVYTADFFWFEVRNWYPAAGRATGSVHRARMLAIPQKNGKIDYEMDPAKPEEDVSCVRSLFSHANQKPCWYVKRHVNDPIPM